MVTLHLPDLSLPKGGGAIRGLGSNLRNPGFRGTAEISVPLDVPQARALAPTLALSYGSGGGNGPHGVGWTIQLPAISRSTARGVPTYTAEDLLISSETGTLTAKGQWQGARWIPDERTVTDGQGVTWQVQVYLPHEQADGLPLIEQWTRIDERTSYWQVTSGDGTVSRFGVSVSTRISDPGDPTRIFQWLLEDVLDTKGNRAQYVYKADDGGGSGAATNRYIERIRYGNYQPGSGADEAFALELVFDYGEYGFDDPSQPGPNPYVPVRPWSVRSDPFYSFRSGFEIRTTRLCRGILTFHLFPTVLGNEPCLTAATRLAYAESPYLSCLDTIQQVGYRRKDDGSYASELLPPFRLTYSSFDPPPAPRFQRLRVDREAALPGYLTPSSYQPVDLDGAGLPGFLQSDDVTTRYYEPMGDGLYGAPRTPASFPDFRNLADSRLSLVDVDSNGRLEIVVADGASNGYFQHRDDGGWSGLVPFARTPTVLASQGLELVDLNGDGKADLLLPMRTALHHYPSRGTEGYGPQRTTARPDGFPGAGANSPVELVVFADVFGDGLSHRLRVIDGEVAVWPSLGHGRFGAKRTLANPPSFGNAIPANRIYLAGVDGSGPADLVIAATDHLLVYRNQSGNGFSAPLSVPLPFRLGDTDQLSFADILGNGTTAIVVTRVLPTVEHWYCDLSTPEADEKPAATKPYLLTGTDNGVGATTKMTYASSTKFYLDDKRAGRPWLTRLPFPVQVVEQAVTSDAVSGVVLTQRFRYHDGYFDSDVRVFRGFGFIESWDAESYQPFTDPPPPSDWPVERVDAELRVPPVYTKTWYWTGAYFQSAALERQYAKEYFAGDSAAAPPPESAFDPALQSARGALPQAFAALAGKIVHVETYADDGDPELASLPYTVSGASFQVLLIQPAGPGGLCALAALDRESIRYEYDRRPADPQVQQSFLLVSTLNDPDTQKTTYYEQRCIVFLARRAAVGVTVYPEQQQIKGTVDETWFARVLSPFRSVGTPYQRQSSEIGGLQAPAGGYFTFDGLAGQVATALLSPIPYGQPFTGASLQARLSARSQSYYWDVDQTAALPLGGITARALLHHTAEARFSEYWRTQVFGSLLTTAMITGDAGLTDDGAGYWLDPGEVQEYFLPSQPGQYFQLCATVWVNPASQSLFARSTVAYDAPYALLPTQLSDFIDDTTSLTTAALIDYQALSPWQVTDSNGVVQQVLFDPLGNVLVQSVFKPAGSGQPRVGDDDLTTYVRREGATFADVLSNKPYYLQGASAFYFYDLLSWQQPVPQPTSAITLQGSRFASDAVPDAPIEATIEFTGGLGHVVENKQQCEPGQALLRDAAGALLRDTKGVPRREVVTDRWKVSGRTVYNNKALPAQEYLPYYSSVPTYEDQQVLADEDLVPPPRITHYDPLGRVIRVDTPKGFFTLTAYSPWQTVQYDEDDTILDAPYYVWFMANYPANPTQAQKDEKAALQKAVPFYNTPTTEIADNVGKTIRRIVCNLGDVQPDAFAAIVSGTGVTSAELRTALITAGYLVTTTTPPGTWTSALFQPFARGFTLTLPPPYDQFAAKVTAFLTQACLTSFLAVDRYTRVLESIDPRLYLADVQNGTTNYNFRYAYPMASNHAARTDGADAGTRWVLVSALDTPVLGWDAMGRRQQKTFDGLSRLLNTVVVEADSSSRTSEVLTYGESQTGAAANNLNGQIYRIEDEAGVALYTSYTILGQVSDTSRKLAVDYKNPLDWSKTVPLQSTAYPTSYTYDALRRPLTELAPTMDLIAWTYWISGRLQSVSVTPNGGQVQSFVTAISYDANDQREQVAYGNQVVQSSTYEDTTQRMIALTSVRPPNGGGGMPRDPTVQAVTYTYDPIGNLSIVRDRTAQLMFCGGTQPVALGDYGYDALYRLASATGLQHPGIEESTPFTGFMQSLYAELCPNPGQQVQLESYVETYGYDDSGNLITTDHAATSASFQRDNPVVATSNQLAGVQYDANGNTLQTDLAAPVTLVWSDRNNLVATGQIQKSDGTFETAWFVYDFTSQRMRRVVDRSPTSSGPPTVRQEQITLPRCRFLLTTDLTTGTTETLSTLSLLDGKSSMVVTNTASSGGGTQIRYQLDDRLNSVSVELGSDASALSYEAFFPFGGTSIIAGNDQTVVSEKLLRYSGEECDDSTGFYYYGARYYLSWQGRWLNPDPSGPVDGSNLFQFVNDNPLTFADVGGRGKGDPKDKQLVSRQDAQAFFQSFVRSYMYAIYNAPRIAFVEAPELLRRRFLSDSATREVARMQSRARLEETRLIYYNLAVAWGFDPENYLHPSVISLIRPRTQPWSMVYVPFYGYPLQRDLRSRTSQPTFLGGQLGGVAGNLTTVGTSLVLLRTLVLSGAPLPVKLVLSPFLLSQALGVLGRGNEMERVYAQHEREQAQLYRWQRAQTPWLSGIPRNYVYNDHIERETERLFQGVTRDQIITAMAGLFLLRAFGPMALRWAMRNWRPSGGGPTGGGRSGGGSGGSSSSSGNRSSSSGSRGSSSGNRSSSSGGSRSGNGSTSTALVVVESEQQRAARRYLEFMRARRQLEQLFVNLGINPVAPNPRNTALVPFRRNNWLVPVNPRNNWLVPVNPRNNWLVPVNPRNNWLVPVNPRNNALMIYRPQNNALMIMQRISQFLRIIPK